MYKNNSTHVQVVIVQRRVDTHTHTYYIFFT